MNSPPKDSRLDAATLELRLESLRSWITGLRDEAPAIRNQAAILIGDTINAIRRRSTPMNDQAAAASHTARADELIAALG